MSKTKTNTKTKRGRGRPKKVIHEDDKEDLKELLFKDIEEGSGDDSNSNSESSSEEEEIILHMPISFKDVDNFNTETEVEGKNTIEESLKVTTDITKSDKSQDKNIFTIADMSCDESSSDDDEYGEDYGEGAREMVEQIKSKDGQIRKLEGIINELKSILTEHYGSSKDPISVFKMLTDLLRTEDGKQVVVEKTKLVCWWDSEQFDTPPCFLPEKFIDGKFHIVGNFCSKECAAAYNISLDDYKVGERKSLQIKCHNMVHPTNQISDIDCAPPWQFHEKYGGIYNTDEFRNKNTLNKVEHRYIMPPMVTIVPYLERSIQENTRLKRLICDDSKDDLVLKRSKPLPNSQNTLIQTIGLIVKN
jgi:hypothetical protein